MPLPPHLAEYLAYYPRILSPYYTFPIRRVKRSPPQAT